MCGMMYKILNKKLMCQYLITANPYQIRTHLLELNSTFSNIV